MSLVGDLHDTETKLLHELREARRHQRKTAGEQDVAPLTYGQKIADWVAGTMGSWKFIIIQSTILAAWIALNLIAVIRHWDPYPFILLNLALSFQAAYAAPFIMMSQNRQQDIDRKKAENDYKINVKAELEIELLHEKLDEMREKEIALLTQTVADLTDLLKRSGMCEGEPSTMAELKAAVKANTTPKPGAKAKASTKPAKS